MRGIQKRDCSFIRQREARTLQQSGSTLRRSPDLRSAGDQGLEPGVVLEISPPPGVNLGKSAPVLGVVGEIPLKEIDRLFLVAELGADKGLVSHNLTTGIDRSVRACAND